MWNSFPQPPDHLFLTYLLYKISIIFGDCSSVLPPRNCVLVTIFTAFHIPGFSATAQTLTLIPIIVPTWLHSVKCSHMDSMLLEPIISLLLKSPVVYQHLLLFSLAYRRQSTIQLSNGMLAQFSRTFLVALVTIVSFESSGMQLVCEFSGLLLVWSLLWVFWSLLPLCSMDVLAFQLNLVWALAFWEYPISLFASSPNGLHQGKYYSYPISINSPWSWITLCSAHLDSVPSGSSSIWELLALAT